MCVHPELRLASSPPLLVVWSQPQVMFPHLPSCREMVKQAVKASPSTPPPPPSEVCVIRATLAVTRN